MVFPKQIINTNMNISFKDWLREQEEAPEHGYKVRGSTLWSQGQGGDAYDYWRNRQRIRPGLDTMNIATGALFGAIDKARGGSTEVPNSGMFQPFFSDYELQSSRSQNYFTLEKEETVQARDVNEAKQMRLELHRKMNDFMRDQYLGNFSGSGGKPAFWKEGEYKPVQPNAAVLLAHKPPHHNEYGDEQDLGNGQWKIVAYGQYRWPRDDIFYGNQLSDALNFDKVGAQSQDTAGQRRNIGANRF